MQKHFKKLSVDFPIEEFTYLKLACTKKGVSIKEFVTNSVIRSIAEYEDELDLAILAKITEQDRKNAISWDEMEEKLGWGKLE